jgi:putative transposase
MSGKFKNQYRIDSARLSWWDYGWNGAYFITICTLDRRHFLGKIKDQQWIPSPEGELALQIWLEIPQHFPYVVLDQFQAMPDHIHGILLINKPADHATATPADPEKKGGCTGDLNPMLHDNIARILRWYKGRCTFEIRKINPHFGWHPRYYDRIIRNEEAFRRVQQYIINNPRNWGKEPR